MVKTKNIKSSANTVYTKKYNTFRGVDFSKDASMVDDEHSPDAINLISDVSGFPEKRVGWRVIQSFDGRINGIFSFDEDGVMCTIVHCGTKIYKVSGENKTLLIEGIADNKSNARYFKGRLCILTGNEYLVFDGEKCCHASEADGIYAPITVMSRGVMKVASPDSLTDTTLKQWYNYGVFQNRDGTAVSYGVMPDGAGINLVSGKRKNHFEASSGNVAFILDGKIDEGTRVVMKSLTSGKMVFDLLFDSEIGRQDYTSSTEENPIDTDYFNIWKTGTAPYVETYIRIGNSNVNNCGYITCNMASEAVSDGIEGVDNFSVEFVSTTEEYRERIDKCTVMDVFENRIFFSGNPDFPNADWYSGVNDPLYIPDINYTEIGVDSCSVQGYLRTGSDQAILKSDGEDATIYMRSYSIGEDGKVLFPIRQGTSGIGAVGKFAVCTFLDDPMYLTRNGVYAIALQDISRERALSIRSTRINKRLLRHADLSSAIMCEWNGYMILAIDGMAYVADAAQRQYLGINTSSFEYEWYYWTNIPARVLSEVRGELVFGTEDGRICKFNTDLITPEGEIEDSAYSDDGKAIFAQWATNLSDDGNFMQEKTMVKTGSGVLLKSCDNSDVSVIVRTENGVEREVVTESLSDRSSAKLPYAMVPMNIRVKKYGAVQIICRNDKVNSPFGIGGIVRRYFMGKIKK